MLFDKKNIVNEKTIVFITNYMIRIIHKVIVFAFPSHYYTTAA
jgi:hypothetical protein